MTERRIGGGVWGIVLLLASGCTDTTVPGDTQRAALEAVYASMDGEGWTFSDGWLTDAPIGEWHGVTVDADGQVTKLDLQENGVGGAIPEEVGELTSLVELIFWNNEITGPIPAELGELTRLEILDLDWNDLTGEVPATLGSLENLEKLYFAKNRLTGPPPPSLGRLSSLTVLHLDCNDIAGAIPVEWTALALAEFHWTDTGLRVDDPAVQRWLDAIPDQESPTPCDVADGLEGAG